MVIFCSYNLVRVCLQEFIWGIDNAGDILLQTTEATTRGVLKKKIFLKILQNSQVNTCVGISFLIKLKSGELRLWHRCFPMSFLKFLGVCFLQNTSGRLFLKRITEHNKTIAFIAVWIIQLSFIYNFPSFL